MTYGAKVSKVGKAVSSTTISDFVLHSEYGSIRFLKYGAGSQVVSASSNATVTITHGAGFFPLVVLFVELTPGSGRWYVAPFHQVTGEDTYVDGDFANTGAGSTTFQFKIINTTGSSKTVNYYYYVIGDVGK